MKYNSVCNCGIILVVALLLGCRKTPQVAVYPTGDSIDVAVPETAPIDSECLVEVTHKGEPQANCKIVLKLLHVVGGRDVVLVVAIAKFEPTEQEGSAVAQGVLKTPKRKKVGRYYVVVQVEGEEVSRKELKLK